jgi:hypothetical protein
VGNKRNASIWDLTSPAHVFVSRNLFASLHWKLCLSLAYFLCLFYLQRFTFVGKFWTEHKICRVIYLYSPPFPNRLLSERKIGEGHDIWIWDAKIASLILADKSRLRSCVLIKPRVGLYRSDSYPLLPGLSRPCLRLPSCWTIWKTVGIGLKIKLVSLGTLRCSRGFRPNWSEASHYLRSVGSDKLLSIIID